MTKKEIIRTKHTVLVSVSSHKSGGRAAIEVSHKALSDSKIFSDVSLRSPIFKSFPLNTLLVVKVTLSGSRRLIGSISGDEMIADAKQFSSIYKDDLDYESKQYDRKHGIKKVSLSLDEINIPEIVDEIEEIFGEAAPKVSSSDIWINERDNELFETIRKISYDRHVAIMMIGGSGYGKTSVPEQKAKDWNMDFLRWDCATVRDPEEFFGYRGAVDASTMTEDGEIFFSESEFTRMIEKGNAVIVLDELNRIDPYISNILFPLLDHAGKTIVAGNEIKVGKNVIFVATINLGFQFTGTFQLDSALTNRFSARVVVGALPFDVERKLLENRIGVDANQSLKIVKMMGKLRNLNDSGKLNLDASTRVSLQVAELINAGLDFSSAINYTLIAGCEPEEKKEIVDIMRTV